MATTAGPERARTPTRTHRFVDAVDARLGLDALRYPVPEHANNLGWSLGGLTAFTFVVLVVTGILLAQFYNPTPEVANSSVRSIVQDVFLALFTGTVLKWDQEGYEALAHNLEVADLLSGAGFWFSPEVASEIPILVRLYTAHMVLIPGLIVLLVTVHALLIKRHGISPHPSLPSNVPDTPATLTERQTVTSPDAAREKTVTAGRGETYRELDEPFTHHLRRTGAFALVLLAGVSVLAVLFPPAVGPTPVAGVEVTKPPWPFWWMYTLENWFGLSAITWGGAALFVLLAAAPFVDRNPARSWRARPVAMTLALLTLLTAVSTPVAHME